MSVDWDRWSERRAEDRKIEKAKKWADEILADAKAKKGKR
jgi:hypothetical protein